MAGQYQAFLDQYTGNNDSRISGADINDYLSSGGSSNKINKWLDKGKIGNDDIKFGGGAQNALDQYVANQSSGGGGGGSSGSGAGDPNQRIDLPDGTYTTMAVFNAEQALLMEKARGTTGVNVADAVARGNSIVEGLRSEANKYLAGAQLKGTMYTADRNLDIAQYQSDALERTNKYVVDTQTASNEAIQALKNQGALDLQAVINSGMVDVEDLRGTYASERVELQGEYDVERANIQSDFEKFKAARAKEGQMYGSLFAGFWN